RPGPSGHFLISIAVPPHRRRPFSVSLPKQSTMLPRIALASLLLTVTVWGCTGGANNGSLTHDPAVPTAGASTEPGEAAPKGESFYAVFNTSKGDIIVEVNPGWA